MEKSAAEQEKELNRTWVRVRGLPDSKSSQRRDFLVKLIELAHSPHGPLKKFAATHFKDLLKDFPDLQEDVINAIYDLCEDAEPMVRTRGYEAIQDVSEAEPKWVKRNVDVLVQLLQTDDHQEVVYVKKALRTHMDIDTISTWGVFCDQICPQDDPMDEEEKQIRNRISTLVLNYLATDAHAHLIRHMEKPQNEKVLIDGLLRAVTKVEPADVRIIVHGILLRLPVFIVPHSSRRKELNEALIRRLVASRKADPSLFTLNDEAIVDIGIDLITNQQVDPSPLSGFFHGHILDQECIYRLSPESQVVSMRACRHVLSICAKGTSTAPGSKQTIKGTFTGQDASTIIIMSVEQGVTDVKTLADLGDMLAACKGAVVSKTWHLSKEALSSLESLQMAITKLFSDDSTGVVSTVQDHIRSILEASSSPAKTVSSPQAQTGSSSARATPVSRQGSDGSRQSGSKRKLEDTAPPQGPRNGREPARNSQPSASTSSRPVERINHGLPPRPGPPTSPRRSQDARRTRDSRPSTPIGNTANSSSQSRPEAKGDNPPPPKRSRVSPSGTTTPNAPLSFKGAAASATASKRTEPERTASSSLIDRIGAGDTRPPQPRRNDRGPGSRDTRGSNTKNDSSSQYSIKGAASREPVENNDDRHDRRGSRGGTNPSNGGSLLGRLAPR